MAVTKRRICIDPGHGGYDSGAVGNGLREKDLTLAVSLFLRDILLADGRFDVILTRVGDYAPGHYENDQNRELLERSRIANTFGAELTISVHFNSFSNPSAYGCEVLDYDGNPNSIGFKFAKAFTDLLSAELGLFNRGVKHTYRQFSVIRETLKDAVITESAFISNSNDIQRFDEPHEQRKLAWYHYRAICSAFAMEPSVQLEQKPKTPLMGNTPDVSAEQMDAFIRKVNPSAPRLGQLYVSIGKMYGIVPVYAFAQMVIETNYLRFTGDVSAEQNNFAGIGAVGGGAKGATFASAEEGIHAQYQHLYAYASKDPLPATVQQIVDPRFQLVNRGSAPYVEDLGGKWAVPGYDRKKYDSFQAAYAANETYGQNIVKVAAEIAKMEVPPVFKDVPNGHWNAENLQLLKDLNVIKGYEDGTFRGDSPATRHEVVAMLANFAREVLKIKPNK